MASRKDTASGKDRDSNVRSSGHGTSRRGFASMDEDKQREIASKGGKAAHEKGTAHEFNSEEAREAGKAAHEKGTAHEFTSEEAREAGRKGGHAAHEKGTAHEFTSEEAREAGRKGGESSHGGRGGVGLRKDEDEAAPYSHGDSRSTHSSSSSGVTQPANAPRAEVKVTKTSSEQNSGSPSGQAASPGRTTYVVAARDESTLVDHIRFKSELHL